MLTLRNLTNKRLIQQKRIEATLQKFENKKVQSKSYSPYIVAAKSLQSHHVAFMTFLAFLENSLTTELSENVNGVSSSIASLS